MESVKKWLTERTVKRNGLYVHYSPPKVVGRLSSAELRQWARDGAALKLQRAVLAGQGRRLLAAADALPLAHLPNLIAKCDALHAAVDSGSLLQLQELLESDFHRRRYIMCSDAAGVGLLHKAIYYDYMDIAQWLVENYPQLVHQRDSEGRTPLHYAAACRDPGRAAALLEGAGAARGARDAAGRTPAFYRGQRTLLALPHPADMPPEPGKNPQGLVIKRHNIRIWCHEVDMSRLQRVVWEGHGARLLSEVSNQPLVKRFLEAVPYIMNTIRDIHHAVIENDLEGLMKLTGDPVPPQILSSRDNNNMTVMHKAAGLGHGGILGYIADRYPQGLNDVDNDGRTPLHYAAAVKDDQHIYNTLVSRGADEGATDNKNKPPGYYINKPNEIDKNLLKALPDAPRTPSSAYPPSWDWKILDAEAIVELNKKSRKKNLRASNENISSKNMSNSMSENTSTRRGGMKGSSTQEFIRDLPDLNESRKKHNGNANATKESEEVEENDSEKKNDEDGNEEENTVDEKDDNEAPVKTENVDQPEVDHDTEDDIKGDDNSENPDVPVEAANDEDNSQAGEDHETGEHSDIEHKDNSDSQADQEVDHTEQNNDEEDDKNVSEADVEEMHSNQNDHKTNDDVEEDEEQKENEEENEEENENKYEDEYEDDKEEEEEEKEEGVANTSNGNNHNIVPITENTIHAIGQTEHKHHNTMLEAEDHVVDTIENHDIQTHETENTKVGEESAPTNEGNSAENSEDDDDVQVHGETQSEYSDIHERSTAEAINTGSAKRGNETNGRNTQESLIEGIISGEAEQDSQDASITQRDETVQGDILVVENEIDPEVAELINSANMEMLATLVLNGEGSRLVGRRSFNAELQSFLDNVPTYMQKINKVHLAAKEGNIKDLQAALDRRKFAIARDSISPNGATPLHVATVFGKTNIIKYLGARFPETLSAVDFEGRTALHYAAILPDNGHYYNLLQQLGANAKDLDDSGKSAEEYSKNPELLPYSQLLADYDISEEAAQSILSDKGTTDAVNGHMDIPSFKTEEGRYLAKSLGDPLIKGLTEVANVKPKDPVAFLASFLHNFPEQEKPQLGTQVMVTKGEGEVENRQVTAAPAAVPKLSRSAARTATRPHRPIDVVTVDPQPETSPDAPEAAFSSVNRDEHGQSMLHFAAARKHSNNALFQLIQESDISLAYRDELYRTARDVSIQANIAENTVEIDKYVLQLAARGNTQKIMEMLLEGYDHIMDVVDEEGVSITDVIAQRGDTEMSNLLASIPGFEESRESLHSNIRRGNVEAVEEALSAEGGRTLARSQNTFGRTALHVAVLAQHEDVVAHLAQTCPELLRIGDNLERTPLHYAMGVEKIESLSRLLIRAGAKRVLKDLKGRQPSYYFMNKSDILRLKEEEEVY